MALDESTEGLEVLNSNNITAYIDPKLKDYIRQMGQIKIDYITNAMGSGYSITVGDNNCASGCGGTCGHES
nr:hypothetical protein [candidate division Zixibacteria bacterium]